MRTLTILIALVASPVLADTKTNATVEFVGSKAGYDALPRQPGASSLGAQDGLLRLVVRTDKGLKEVALAGIAAPEETRKAANKWLSDALLGKKVRRYKNRD